MGWFETRVRRVAAKQIALAATVVAGLTAFAASESRYLKNYFAGPLTMSGADLVKITDPDKLERYWVNVKPDEVIDTGIDQTTTTRRRRGGSSTSVTGHYYTLRFGNRLVITEAETDVTPTGTIEASIVPLKVNLFSPTAPAEFKARFVPFMLQAKPFAENAQWGLIIGGLLSLGALGYALRAARQWSKPQNHPAVAALVARPDFSLAAAGERVAADIAAKSMVQRKGHQLTSGFYAKTGGLKFASKPLDDLLWAYHEVTNKKIYWIIPAGSSHAIKLGFRDEMVDMPTTKGQAEGTMAFLAQNAPWALLGHGPELAAAYASQRRELIAFVEGRKVELAQTNASAPPRV